MTKTSFTRTGEWKPVFLEHLSRMGNVTRAIRAAKVTPDTAYAHRRSDPEFARAWRQSLRQACDVLEAEAWRRAVKGTEKPVFHQGAACGTVREYSDTLLIFLLKGNRPKKFRDNMKVEHSGKVKQDHVHTVDLSQFSDEELLKFERAFARGAGGTDPPGRN